MQGKSQWLIMVYLAGDNNLGTAMTWAIKEIYRTFDPTKGVDVVIQYDPSAVGPHIRRYDLRQTQIGLSQAGGQPQVQALPTEEDGLLETWGCDVTEQGLPAIERVNFWPRLTFVGCNPEYRPVVVRKDGRVPTGEFEPYRRLPKIPTNMRIPENLRITDDWVTSSSYIRRLVESSRYNIENSADPQVLLEFMNYCEKAYPERHRMLVLSGHGSGAIGDFLRDEISEIISQSSGTSDLTPCSLSIPHLAWVLEKFGRPIHILGMDSCLMSMAEVCAEVQKSVSNIVGGEGMGLNLGWPFRKILPIFYSDSGIPADAGAKAVEIVRRYIQYYGDYQPEGVSADHAALNLKNWPNLELLISELANKLIAAMSSNIDAVSHFVTNYTVLAHWRCQSYKYDQYVDLWDFCDCLCNMLSPIQDQLISSSDVRATCTDLCQCCNNLKSAVDSLVSTNSWSGVEYQHSHGLSIYFPWNHYIREYNELQLAKNTDWDCFLYHYVEKTMASQRTLEQCPPNAQSETASIEPVEDWLSRFGHEGRPKFGAEGRPKGTGRGWSMRNPPTKFNRCRRTS